MTNPLRDTILSLEDQSIEPVSFRGVKGWSNIKLFVRSMSAKERDSFEAWCAEHTGKTPPNWRARMCVHCACDDTGKPVFTLADVDAIGAKSAAALDRIFQKATALNKLSAEDVEALEKN
jgi:hypothetical protein